MKFHLLTVCHLALLSLYVLVTVRQSESTFVPGRCLCPETRPAVREPLKGLTVYYRNPTCNKATVIVTLRRNDAEVCVDPKGAMGRRLIHCWKRAHREGRDVKHCLRRRGNASQGRRIRDQGRKSLSS